MSIGGICWYLCGLLAVALILTSFITAHPSAQSEMAVIMAGEAALSIVFGILATVFNRLNLAEPRWLVRVFLCLAVLLTILMFIMVGG